MLKEEKLLQLAREYSERRAQFKNAHNGHAYISCVILGKDNQCVLRVWDKCLQC